jgi:hypothetical protein
MKWYFDIMNPMLKHLDAGECLIFNTGESDAVVTFSKLFSDELIVVNHCGGVIMAPVSMITIPPFVVQKYTAKLERETKMSEHKEQVESRKAALTKAQESRKAKDLELRLENLRMLVEFAEEVGDLPSFRKAQHALSELNDEVVDFITGVSA